MNTTLQYISYLCLSVVFCLFSLLLIRRISKATHRGLLFKAGFIYNTALVLLQVNFFLKGQFPFVDTFKNSYIVFLGLAFSFFHIRNIGALETKVHEKMGTRLEFDNSFIKLLDRNIDQGLSLLKWMLIILATSAFYTAMIGYLLIQMFPIESLDIPTRRILGVILYLGLAALGTYLTYKHHQAKRYNPIFKKERTPPFGLTEKRLQNIFHGLRVNWLFLIFSIYCATMTILLLDEFANFDILKSPWRNFTKTVIYLLFLIIWLYGTIIHHRIKRKSEMKNLR